VKQAIEFPLEFFRIFFRKEFCNPIKFSFFMRHVWTYKVYFLGTFVPFFHSYCTENVIVSSSVVLSGCVAVARKVTGPGALGV